MVAINKRTIRERISSRGGGIEIHLDRLRGGKYNGHKMTAYQNYLGGGMLGRIDNDCTIKDWKDDKNLLDLAKQLSIYLHKQTNGDESLFNETQERSSSLY